MKTLNWSPLILICAVLAIAETAYATQPPDVVTSDANNNTAMGSNALLSLTAGTDNTASGAQALEANTTGGQNTAFGANALYNSNTGSNNTAVGFEALFGNAASENTAFGSQALENTSGGSAHSPNAKGNFQFERVITGWRGTPVLDLRLKR